MPDHPHICALHDVGELEGAHYLGTQDVVLNWLEERRVPANRP